MVEKIQINSTNPAYLSGLGNKDNKSKNQPSFTGFENILLAPILACEKLPMVNVTVLDLSTAIVPRTIYESQTNAYAGLEAFRRESSGLVVNCLIPSFIVLGIAMMIQRLIMGPGYKMHKSWANEDTIKTITKYYQHAEGKDEAKVANTYKNMVNAMYGQDGNESVKFVDKDLSAGVDKFISETLSPSEKTGKQIKKAIDLIVEKTNVSQAVNLGTGKEKYTGKLSEVLGEAPRVIRELQEFIKRNSNISEKEAIEKFIQKSTKLVKAKSLLGLGVIIPLAVSMQPINRWLTEKNSGKKGAPIYKDFETSEQKELSKSDKSALFSQKIISVGAMLGVALLSIMKKPGVKAAQVFKEVSQFRGIFPSMDQARIISTATFASRMLASEDKNDLREATVRDIATFSAFYFLGDYVAKGIATFIQKISKGKHKLLNYAEDFDAKAKGLKQFKEWMFKIDLKSTDEVVSKSSKNMRAVCQLGNILFSLAALGILIPMMNRKKTEKKRKEELKNMGIDSKTIDKNNPQFKMNNAGSTSKK